jgi:hypothetical protein
MLILWLFDVGLDLGRMLNVEFLMVDWISAMMLDVGC